MYIEELIADDLITIEASKGENIIKIETSVVEVSSDRDIQRMESIKEKIKTEHCVLVKVLKDDDNILDFSSNSVKCSAIGIHETKLYQWLHVGLVKMKFADLGMVHLMVSNDESKTFNRRSEYRLSLFCEADLHIKDVTGRFRCIVRDISAHGIGIMVNTDLEIDKQSVISIVFTYEETQFEVRARVIRKVHSNNNRVLVGCLIGGCNVDLPKFINAEQSKRMRVNN